MGRFRDLVGQRFGDISVHSHAGFLDGRHRWICRCACGHWTVFRTDEARSRNDCGCSAKKRSRLPRAHGHARNGNQTSEYNCYYNMLQRCYNPKCKAYGDYGARGIEVCARWRYGNLEKSGFECFIADLGLRPKNTFWLERENYNGNYEPANVSWKPREIQNSNTRRNIFVVLNGQRMTLSAAQRITGFSRCKIDFWRAKGMTIQEIFDKLYDGTYRKTERPTKKITFAGETHTLYEWAKIQGIGYSRLKARISAGWPTSKALTAPIQKEKITQRAELENLPVDLL